MASAAPSQIRCGVTVCMPSGIGFTCDVVMSSPPAVMVSRLAQKHLQITPQVLKNVGGDLGILFRLGEYEGTLQAGLHEIANAFRRPSCIGRVTFFRQR